MLALLRLRILFWLGICALAALSVFFAVSSLDDPRAPAGVPRAVDAAFLDPRPQPAELLPGPEPRQAERSVVAQAGSQLRIQLRSATTPLSPLSLVLHSSAEPRRLSTRDSLVLRDLPLGSYQLSSEERCWTSAPVDFELGASAAACELEFPIEALGPWRARVLDARDGSGIEGLRLRWLVRGELGDMEYRAELGQAEIALDAGRFQVACSGYLARESQLSIEASGFEPFSTPWIEYDGHRAVDLGELVLLPANTLQARIAGRVLAEESGAALQGVRVWAVAAEASAQQVWMLHAQLQGAPILGEARACSDAQGGFELQVPQHEPVRLAAWLPARGLLLSSAIENQVPVELRMPLRARILGRVLTTPELRASGAIQGVNVDAAGRQTGLALDEELRFELGGLPAGPVRIALEALEVQTAGQSVLAEVAVRSLLLHEGEQVEIELRYGLDTQPWAIDGRVLLPDDVDWAMLRAALWLEGDSGPSRFAVIDREGYFRMQGEPPGIARVFVGGSSADSSRCALAMHDLDTAAVELAEFDLRSPTVRGSVWVSGVPAAGVPLRIDTLDASPAWARAIAESLAPISDAAGRFQIHGLEPGAYTIGRVGGPRLRFQVQGGAARALELRLE